MIEEVLPRKSGIRYKIGLFEVNGGKNKMKNVLYSICKGDNDHKTYIYVPFKCDDESENLKIAFSIANRHFKTKISNLRWGYAILLTRRKKIEFEKYYLVRLLEHTGIVVWKE